jgi:hypothetical protein
MKKVVNIHAARADFCKFIEQQTPSRKLGFAIGEISDLSDSEWEALDSKFNALFGKAQFS